MAQCQENLSEMAPEFLPPGLREGDSRSDHIGGRDICGLDEGTNGYTENTMKISSPHMKLEGSEHPVLAVGEIRQNLDCLKASVLGYYSRLYTDSGKSIEERLDRLSADYCRTRVPRVPPFASQLGNTNPRRVKIDSHSPDATSQFTSRSTRGMGLGQSEKEHIYSMPQPSGTKASVAVLGHPNTGSHETEVLHEGLLNDMIKELRKKCVLATKRLNSLGDYMEREVEDPALREWEFSTYPQIRRRPSLGGNRDLRDHLLTLYQHLSNQAHINQMKIRAMRSKVKVLNMHTKADMIKMKSDPRVGF